MIFSLRFYFSQVAQMYRNNIFLNQFFPLPHNHLKFTQSFRTQVITNLTDSTLSNLYKLITIQLLILANLHSQLSPTICS